MEAGLVLAFASGAAARANADVKASLTCSGATCTLVVTNTSGHAFLQLSMILQGFPAITKMTDPKASSQNVGAGGSTIVTIPAGECWVGTGQAAGQAACAAFTADHSPAWADGQAHTITITAASAVAKGARISLCPQAGSGGVSCSDVGFGASSGTTTGGTATPTPKYHDIGVEIVRTTPILHLTKLAAKEELKVAAKVKNIGNVDADVEVELRFPGLATLVDFAGVILGAERQNDPDHFVGTLHLEAGASKDVEFWVRMARYKSPAFYDYWASERHAGKVVVLARSSARERPNRLPNSDIRNLLLLPAR